MISHFDSTVPSIKGIDHKLGADPRRPTGREQDRLSIQLLQPSGEQWLIRRMGDIEPSLSV